ncbi:MAG: hypothetical protein ABII18_03100 [bacterium]|nr:hypothetical protein [bacterium]MBU1919179.1 hypothetical protein [bacterium]
MGESSVLRQYGLPALSREDFNRLAKEIGDDVAPFRWISDDKNPGIVDPDELLFPRQMDHHKYIMQRPPYTFTLDFHDAYVELVNLKRREVVRASLDEAIPVTFQTDLRHLSAPKKAMVRELVVTKQMIETLYRKQNGSYKYVEQVAAARETDPESYALFMRNEGPWCEAPATAANPFCHALFGFPKQVVGVYPSDIDVTDEFCASLTQEQNDPMTLLAYNAEGDLVGTPYHEQEYYAHDMIAVARSLERAAGHLNGIPEEKAMVDYLLAAANAFRTGDWENADEKWVAMNRYGGDFALRVAPDEQYWDPCGRTAGFEFWFAVIDKEAEAMVDKFQLAERFAAMEEDLASLTPLYEPKQIAFDLPDFSRTAMIAGDAHFPRSVMLGQMLPNSMNHGPRMNIFTGHYLDQYSMEMRGQIAQEFMAEENLLFLSMDPEYAGKVSTLVTMFHELTHSLGPNPYRHTFVVNTDGSQKLDDEGEPIELFQALGPRNAVALEEIKGQTGSLYWTGWFLEKGLIDETLAKELYTECIRYILKKLGKGIVNPATDRPGFYEQLCAVQLKAFMDAGAVTFEDGKFHIHYDNLSQEDKLYQTSRELMAKVLDIALRGDKEGAEALLNDVTYSQLPGYQAIHAQHIYDRTETMGIKSISATIEPILD